MQSLSERLNELDYTEILELEEFTDFLLYKRSQKNIQFVKEDIPTNEITKLISSSDSFKWLDSTEEDIYSPTDGVPAEW